MTSWKTNSSCNDIKGVEGAFWPPFLNRKEPLWVFAPDICRSLSLHFNQESTFSDIPVWLYTANKELFQGIELNKENVCFCGDLESGDCEVDGIFDVYP